jgi:hypothetical protein
LADECICGDCPFCQKAIQDAITLAEKRARAAILTQRMK